MKKISTFIAFAATLIGLAFNAEAQTHRIMPLLSGSGLTIGAASTTNLIAANRNDVSLWVNTDGSQPNISLLLSGLGTNSPNTNAIDVALVLLPDGTNAITSGGTNTYRFNINGTTRATILTNITAGIEWKGAKKVRVSTVIVHGTHTGQTIQASLTGFVP